MYYTSFDPWSATFLSSLCKNTWKELIISSFMHGLSSVKEQITCKSCAFMVHLLTSSYDMAHKKSTPPLGVMLYCLTYIFGICVSSQQKAEMPSISGKHLVLFSQFHDSTRTREKSISRSVRVWFEFVCVWCELRVITSFSGQMNTY